MINLNNLSSGEVINYAHNGRINAIPANVFLSIIREYEERISDAEAEKSQQGYDNSYDSGYDDGWAEAVEDMQRHLNGM